MKSKLLTDVCNITTGKLDSNAAVKNGKYPFFTCAPEPLSIDDYAFDDDAILLAGNNAQGNFHLNRFNGRFNAYQRTYVITAKDGYDIDYIRYTLEYSLNYLKQVAQGSQTKFLTMQILNSFTVLDMEYKEQIDRIASLKAIDKKIENNLKIYNLFESMIDKLYGYWFVQFDFPNAEGESYHHNGGAMRWDSSLKREIPESWQCLCLSDISEIMLKTVTPENETVFEHYSIPAFDADKTPIIELGINIDSNKYSVPADGILVSKLNPQFKRVWPILEANAHSICSTEFMPFVSTRSQGKEFLYAILRSDAFNRYTVSCASSSTGSRKRVSPEVCLHYKLAYPNDEEIIQKFCEIVRPYLKQMIIILAENKELNNLRNKLLPMIITGQLSVE